MTHTLAGVPVGARYFEDYVPGSVVDCGAIDVDHDEVLAFGRRFDPQPFHADPAAAAAGPFGGLIASGWHTGALMMRLFVQKYISSVASLASPGAESLQWLAPVRPGDRLHVVVSVLYARRSRSKPDRGIVVSLVSVRNQDEVEVMTMKVTNLLACRPATRG
ncbi:MAG TPA: MaoC/PaaZ C-terminal domain-containing protein [Casimicrobiaceae bacterium]|nr:MaoC/PaaZ C-terminal domain-containing protein [Casimicrobiaceae bacterium]